jgi:transcriptional regulator with XRE-family HTH domain
LTICQMANYTMNMKVNNSLGRIIKQQRLMVPLTLQELATMADISPSHLGRIERGERFPSAHVLRRIAGPLGFDENELFTLAGYLSPQPPAVAESEVGYSGGRLDPYVSRVLAQEPLEVQRAVIGILSVLKSIAKGMTEGSR